MENSKYKTPYGTEGIIDARTVARQLALHGLSGFYRLAGRMNYLTRNRVQFIYLHHLFPEEEAGFRRLLSELSRRHTLISFSEAVDRVKSGNIDKPYVCFSFDDGFKQCLRAGEILNEFGIAGCFFICPSYVGETDWRKLQEICETRFAMPAMELLSWDDVERMLELGQEIGSHTMNHNVLSRISGQQVEDEVIGSREFFFQRLGGVRHFAWPEGRYMHFSPVAARIVSESGYDSCSSAERGCHVTKPDMHNFCLRRDYISAQWPLSHAMYFLAKNSMTALPGDNGWPLEWVEKIAEPALAG